jgi:hypothetical protein
MDDPVEVGTGVGEAVLVGTGDGVAVRVGLGVATAVLVGVRRGLLFASVAGVPATLSSRPTQHTAATIAPNFHP